MAFPRFAEKGEDGLYLQQDACEFWIELIQKLQLKLKSSEGGIHSNSFIDQYFGVIFKVEMKCKVSEYEPPVYLTEISFRLDCFISAGISCFLIFFN
jgi:ubiquitin carboxyl-terminal hydrolase 14